MASVTVARTTQHERNNVALIALVCGVVAWVPFVTLLAAPLTVVFALWALWRARDPRRREGTSAAGYGIALMLVGVGIQLVVLSTGTVVSRLLGF